MLRPVPAIATQPEVRIPARSRPVRILNAVHESMITTIRGVGYKLVPAEQARAERGEQPGRAQGIAAAAEQD